MQIWEDLHTISSPEPLWAPGKYLRGCHRQEEDQRGRSPVSPLAQNKHCIFGSNATQKKKKLLENIANYQDPQKNKSTSFFNLYLQLSICSLHWPLETWVSIYEDLIASEFTPRGSLPEVTLFIPGLYSCPLEVMQFLTDLDLEFQKGYLSFVFSKGPNSLPLKKFSLGKKFQKNLLSDSGP